jgi:hypothetical protein
MVASAHQMTDHGGSDEATTARQQYLHSWLNPIQASDLVVRRAGPPRWLSSPERLHAASAHKNVINPHKLVHLHH